MARAAADSSSYKVCDGTGEDRDCSDGVAWDALLYASDHCTYLAMPICTPVCSGGARSRVEGRVPMIEESPAARSS